MNDDDAVNLVALTLESTANRVHEMYRNVLQGRPFGLMLLVSVSDQTQYVSNVHRDRSIEMLTQLLNRWKAGMADKLPGETTASPDPLFELMLNEYGSLLVHAQDDAHEHHKSMMIARQALINHVGELQAKLKRQS